jgi:hypothetical protein
MANSSKLPPSMSVRELARKSMLSESTLRRQIAAGSLVATRREGLLHIEAHHIESWLASHDWLAQIILPSAFGPILSEADTTALIVLSYGPMHWRDPGMLFRVPRLRARGVTIDLVAPGYGTLWYRLASVVEARCGSQIYRCSPNGEGAARSKIPHQAGP